MDRAEIAPVEEMIVTVRGQRVILADDLARVYGVETRVLNQAVRRHIGKFPRDFMFQIARGRSANGPTSKITVCDLKARPAFEVPSFRFHGARSDHGGERAE